MNADSSLWLNRLGRGFECEATLPASTSNLLLSGIATVRQIHFDHEHPILETIFPLTGDRTEGLIAPVVTDAVVALRTRQKRLYSLRVMTISKWPDNWRHLLSLGVTGWPESERAQSRSDCHGWGDHPNIEIYRTVLGIESGAAGFKRIRLAPHMGKLTWVSGTVPHPGGVIGVEFRKQSEGRLQVEVRLPFPGELVWQGKLRSLSPGYHKFTF